VVKVADNKQDLSQAYTFNGTTYGPGAGVTVPEDFPDVSKHEAAFKAAQDARARAAGDTLVPASMDTNADVATGEPSHVANTVSGKTAEQLSEMTKPELVALAEEKGITVTRADGKDSEPLVEDYERALSAPAA
jgi:hypothetical protein